MKVSVVLCTYNPRLDYLQRVISALKEQNLPFDQWELILVDNNSNNGFQSQVDLSWHPNGQIIKEPKPGLTPARITGIRKANSEVIVCVDDDNILREDYLQNSLHFMEAHPEVGATGGKSIPNYETPPPAWFSELNISLGCRDLGDETRITAQKGHALTEYWPYSPIGTGMVIRRQAFLDYAEEAERDPVRKALGRTGKSLNSGEDNDMVLTLIKNGWEVAYSPDLYIDHLIPSKRLEPAYLAEMNRASSKSWVQVLAVHGIVPWPPVAKWLLPLRKVRTFFRNRAWKGDLNYIRWRGACGIFEGRASIHPNG